MRTLLTAVLALALGGLSAAQDDKPDPRAERLAELKAALKEEGDALQKRFAAAESPAKKDALREQYFKARAAYAWKVLALAAEKPADAVGFEGAGFALRNGNAEVSGKAAALLAAHHAANPKLKPVIPLLGSAGAPGRSLLAALSEKGADADTRGLATLALGDALVSESDTVGDVAAAKKLLKEAEAALTRAAKEFPDVAAPRGTVGELAEEKLELIRTLAVGRPAPAVEGRDLDGKPVKLSDYRGKVVVVDIWATWCPPCRAMIPHERELVKRLEGKPFVLLSVSADDTKKDLTDFLKDNPMPWTHWWDGRDGDVTGAFRVRAFPTIYVLDGTGTIRYRGVRGEEMDKAVDTLLKEMTK